MRHMQAATTVPLLLFWEEDQSWPIQSCSILASCSPLFSPLDVGCKRRRMSSSLSFSAPHPVTQSFRMILHCCSMGIVVVVVYRLASLFAASTIRLIYQVVGYRGITRWCCGCVFYMLTKYFSQYYTAQNLIANVILMLHYHPSNLVT